MRPKVPLIGVLVFLLGGSYLALHLVQSPALAQGAPTRVAGGGEAIAAAFVQYIGHDLQVRNVPSINTIGNRITFGLNATKRPDGKVEGQMQLVDHALGLVIHSDVVSISPHPVHQRPVGSLGGPAFRMSSSTGGVMINGEPQPGWQFRNSPTFDGGEGAKGAGDTICFELFNAAGAVVQQWSAFLSSGNVQIISP